MPDFTEWMNKHVPEDCRGQCKEITERMAEAFPDLIRVRGHYYCHTWGERAHWWLKTEDGEIVDPTASQFPSKGIGRYVEWDEGAEEPTGRCIECGGYCYGGKSFCSDACETAGMAYYKSIGATYNA